MEELTPERMTRLKAAFDIIDRDGDGKIKRDDLINQFRAIGEPLSVEQADSMIEELDADGSGYLDFTDFVALMGRRMRVLREDVDAAFKACDRDHDGKISFSDMKKLLTSLNVEISDRELRRFWQDSDQDRDNSLSYEEFLRVINRK